MPDCIPNELFDGGRCSTLSNRDIDSTDRDDFSELVLLYTVNHEVLLKRLDISYGVTGCALKWCQSYLCGQTKHVPLTKSFIARLRCGVSQGSVFGPILLVLCTAELVCLVKQYRLQGHLFAHDTQVIGSCRPRDVSALQS